MRRCCIFCVYFWCWLKLCLLFVCWFHTYIQIYIYPHIHSIKVKNVVFYLEIPPALLLVETCVVSIPQLHVARTTSVFCLLAAFIRPSFGPLFKLCVRNQLIVVVVFCYLLTTNLRLTTNWITQQFTSCVMCTTNCSLGYPFILLLLFNFLPIILHIIINCCGTRCKVYSIQIYKCTAS